MATLALDVAPDSTPDTAADLSIPEALLEVGMAFLDAGMVRSADRLFAMAADAGADAQLTAAGRRTTLQLSATDDAIAQRMPSGTVMLPSVERGEDGSPRFLLPLLANVVGQSEVLQVINAELTGDGVDPELRNFLDAFLEEGDVLVDCDPGFGFPSLSASTRPDVAVGVIARAADDDHAAFLQRAFGVNDARAADVALPKEGIVQSLTSLLALRAVAQAARIVIYAGTADDLVEVQDELVTAMQDRRVAAIAWSVGADGSTRDVRHVLASSGGAHFVVAVDAEGVLLVPEDQMEGSSLIITIPAHSLVDRSA